MWRRKVQPAGVEWHIKVVLYILPEPRDESIRRFLVVHVAFDVNRVETAVVGFALILELLAIDATSPATS